MKLIQKYFLTLLVLWIGILVAVEEGIFQSEIVPENESLHKSNEVTDDNV